jgi:phosphatidylserine/phosphatidylglycerophosphate/cardiolipin synthase-like enzyme
LELGDLSLTVLNRNPDLNVYVLSWDFVRIYARDREPRGEAGLGRTVHPRLHVRYDSSHPILACHHQKVVVIDDALAFVGGLDLTVGRWDTSEHRSHEPLRRDARGSVGPPFHDVMMAVDAEAAAALGDLCRERWWRACGERLAPIEVQEVAWPPDLPPDLEDVRVAISRTEPGRDGRSSVREVEALNSDAIHAARRLIYLETQYLTARSLCDDLAAQLAKRDGPEVVAVVPRDATDSLEKWTMGVMRGRLVSRLRGADRHGRLRVVYPTVPGIGRGSVKVHSKVLIVDDRFLRIGSSNFCNRSLGVDTECDVSIEADGDPRIAHAIAALHCRLLAEHLGRSPGQVADETARSGSVVGFIDDHRNSERALIELEVRDEGPLERIICSMACVDPLNPLQLVKRSPVEATNTRRISTLGDLAARFVSETCFMVAAWLIARLLVMRSPTESDDAS